MYNGVNALIPLTASTGSSPSPAGAPSENIDNAGHAERLSRTRRNVGEPGKYWPQHSTIKIAMYDYPMDDPYVLAVKKAASEWSPYINLTFEFVSGEEGDVRITQNESGNDGGSSRVGTDALENTWAPTMSLPQDHTAPNFAYTVTHEFGHMLGAHHAHQHPDANIPWDRTGLAGTFTQDEIEKNVLPLPRDGAYDYLPYDSDSIMHYSIRAEWASDNTHRPGNSILSEGDIAWAKKAYPKRAEQ